MSSRITVKEKIEEIKSVFSTEPIKKGDVVLEWNKSNIYLSIEEVNLLSEGDKTYVGIFDGKYVLIAEPGRYVNHSCNPNIRNENGVDYALRDIDSGEEIFGDYGDGGALIGFKCSCGSTNCRKFVKGAV